MKSVNIQAFQQDPELGVLTSFSVRAHLGRRFQFNALLGRPPLLLSASGALAFVPFSKPGLSSDSVSISPRLLRNGFLGVAPLPSLVEFEVLASSPVDDSLRLCSISSASSIVSRSKPSR